MVIKALVTLTHTRTHTLTRNDIIDQNLVKGLGWEGSIYDFVHLHMYIHLNHTHFLLVNIFEHCNLKASQHTRA